MKKLTAGILTVMLGIVAANSADASIASKGYVDAQVGTKVSTSDFETFQGTNTSAIADAKKAGTDASAELTAYKTTASDTFATKTALSEGLATKQNTLTAGDGINIATDGTISTKGIATSDALTTLEGKVTTNTDAISTLTGSGDGSVAKSIADALKDYTTTTDLNDELAKKADKTTIGDITGHETVAAWIGDVARTASGATTDVSNRVTTIESSAAYKSGITSGLVTQISTNKTDIATNAAAISAMDTAYKAADTAINKKIGDVTDGKTVVEMIGDVTSAANEELAKKQDKLTASDVSVTGSGNVITAITAADGKITATAGTTLGALATAAPGACSEPTKKCALVFDGTAYSWEVIERDSANQ